MQNNRDEIWDNYLEDMRKSISTMPNSSDAPHTREGGFRQFQRKQIAELRPYLGIQDSITGVSISLEDHNAGSPKPGDMIARNPNNHADMWLVAAQYFQDNFEPISTPIPLTPSSDGCRVALADLVDAISHSDFGMTEEFLLSSFRRAQDALAVPAATITPSDEMVAVPRAFKTTITRQDAIRLRNWLNEQFPPTNLTGGK